MHKTTLISLLGLLLNLPAAAADRATTLARRRVDALPAAARVELRRMFLRYSEEVARRLEEGWESGVLTDAVIKGIDEPFQPARQREKTGKSRRRIISRTKGACRDWSDDIWSALTALKLEHWTISDRRRAARPLHTGAVACADSSDDDVPSGPRVCLVFDPWADGAPDVFAYEAWDAAEPGGKFPPNYFLHELPEKAPKP